MTSTPKITKLPAAVVDLIRAECKPEPRRHIRLIPTLCWIFFLLVAWGICINQVLTPTENVMQQCALAARDCFWLIAGYVCCRAISEIGRS